MEILQVLEQVDLLFDQNQAKKAEELLVESLAEARSTGDQAAQLQLLNELIGYYRQTSEKEELLLVIGQALSLAEEMGLSGSLPYATTALNAANGYRAMGDLANAVKYYAVTEEIYERELSKDDMLLSGFYNNYSLCLQELGKFWEAQECLLKALEIVEKNGAGFETAVTYANLANTAVMGGQYEQAKQYGQKAVECFKSRNLYDAHYCAALSALGMCYYHEGSFDDAEKMFLEGMTIIENTLGRNRQYERLAANLEQCRRAREKKGTPAEAAGMTGLELCRAYYETCGRPALEEQFPEYLSKMAIGLAGEGSDCFGYDDEISRDHDWGPGFCIWVSEETYAEIGPRLEELYDSLPREFMGYGRQETARGKGRRGVMTISSFYQNLLGTDRYEEIDWNSVPDYALAAATNGQVFRDEEGTFSALREKLCMGYPEAVRYGKLARDAAMFSQTGQYNYLRMLKRGDRLTADRMLCDCIGYAMELQHHICRVYPPHDKWLLRSVERLDRGAELKELLDRLHHCLSLDSREAVRRGGELLEELGSFFAMELYALNDISDVDPYLDFQTEELLWRSGHVEMPREELVDRIVRLEFQAFDQVKNEGGRAYCQNDWPTFSIMRKSQYLTWNQDMLMQYLYDFEREFRQGHNLITEKYGRMMKSTAPERYRELEVHFPEISPEKQNVIEQIVALQMSMMEEFAAEHPKVAGNARNLHTYEDNIVDTSYETYLRGEISTYSDKMLQLYGSHVVACAAQGVNIARQTIENTARLYGYPDLDSFEAGI